MAEGTKGPGESWEQGGNFLATCASTDRDVIEFFPVKTGADREVMCIEVAHSGSHAGVVYFTPEQQRHLFVWLSKQVHGA